MNNTLTRFLALLLVLALIIPCAASAADADDLRGYEQSHGYVYVEYGEYPRTRAGETAPILWRILSAEDSRLFLLSEYVLFPCRIEAEPKDYVDYAGTEVYEVLNTSFLSVAFSPAQQQTLIDVDGFGKAFLLSRDDVRNAAYGFTNNAARSAVRTGWARVKGTYTFKDTSISPYWLRDQSDKYDLRNLRVGEGGSVGSLSMNSKDQGVRPCVYVSMSMISISGGEGTRKNPYTLKESVMPAATAAATAAVTAAPTAAAATTSALPQPTATIAPTAPPVSAVAPVINITADAAYDAFMSELPEDGFSYEGVAQYSNASTGHWVYSSTDTYIHITKHASPVVWYEANVQYYQPARFAPVAYQTQNRESMSTPQEIAATHKTIFGVSSDGYVQRAATEGSYTGFILRANQVLSDDGGAYDQLALLSDGSMLMSPHGQFTADDYKYMDAANVMSCGPLLISNGVIAETAADVPANQPLLAIGEAYMGSLYCIYMDASAAETGTFIAERLLELGCQNAILMTSGASACMVFMGEVITPATSAVMSELLMVYGGNLE